MDSNASLKIVKRARALRKTMTEPEIICPAAKLAIEIDGSTHWEEEKRAKDEARDRWLAGQDITVMRIGAGSVYRNLGQVADGVILRALELIEARG